MHNGIAGEDWSSLGITMDTNDWMEIPMTFSGVPLRKIARGYEKIMSIPHHLEIGEIGYELSNRSRNSATYQFGVELTVSSPITRE